ncbi:DUF3833 domain-containing protein [Aurantivibrio infirmus]
MSKPSLFTQTSPSSFLLISLTSLLAACSGVSVDDYSAANLKLIPQEFFEGKLSAHGVVKNRSGKVIRYFNASIDANWENGVGTLDEHFLFDDGEKQQRIWTLVPSGESTFVATAGDVIGKGSAKYAGNSLFLDYVLRVPYNDGSIDLKIDDRMYLVNSDTLINESGMYKFGVKVGSILIVINKKKEESS